MRNMPFLKSQFQAIEKASLVPDAEIKDIQNYPLSVLESNVPKYFIDYALPDRIKYSTGIRPGTIYFSNYVSRTKNTFLKAEEFFGYYKTFSLPDNWELFKNFRIKAQWDYSQNQSTTYNQFPVGYYTFAQTGVYTLDYGSSTYMELGETYHYITPDSDFTNCAKIYNSRFLPTGGLESLDFSILIEMFSNPTITDGQSGEREGIFLWEKYDEEGDLTDYQFEEIGGIIELNMPLTLDDVLEEPACTIDTITDESVPGVQEGQTYGYADNGTFLSTFVETFETDDDALDVDSEYSEF